MPPKFKFTKEEIIAAAFQLIRREGWGAFSTRALAEELGSSAKPIYSFFKSMDQLTEAVAKKGVELLYEYMIQKRTGDPWHDHGIGYVIFAQEEKRLFRGLNDEKRIAYYRKYGDIIWGRLTLSLADYPPFQGLSDEQIYEVQLDRWLLAHGLAFQVSTHPPGVWEDDKIVLIIQRGSKAILKGLTQQGPPMW